jgi:hypothetical protein
MKEISNLNIITKFSLKNGICIHPNDGFEIGLMNHSYDVNLFFNIDMNLFSSGKGENFKVKIFLLNECKMGTIEIPNNFFVKLGKPNKVILSIEGNNILLSNCK